MKQPLWRKAATITACIVGPIAVINYLPNPTRVTILSVMAEYWVLTFIPLGLIIIRAIIKASMSRKGGKK